MLVRACDQGGGRACTALADETAQDFPRGYDPPLAQQRQWLRLVERGCEQGDAEACFRAASVARRGAIGAPDAAAARRWLRAGCALEPSGGTSQLAIDLGRADAELSVELRRAGCADDPAPSPRFQALCP
jgi:TPR repeat protein